MMGKFFNYIVVQTHCALLLRIEINKDAVLYIINYQTINKFMYICNCFLQ